VLCIFCRKEKPPRTGEGEHVVPLAIGGSWTIDRVCVDCDSEFGSRIDSRLIKLTRVEERRIELELTGHSRRVPNPLREALAQPVRVVGAPHHRLKVNIDELGQYRVHTIPNIEFIVTTFDDGSWLVELPPNKLVLDPSNREEAVPMISRRLKEALAEAGIAINDTAATEASAHLVSGLTLVEEEATVEAPFAIREGGDGPALVKIVYESAWYWLGDQWLDDPVARAMNAQLHGDQGIELRGRIKRSAGTSFNLGELAQRDAHVLFLFNTPADHYIVEVQLFDIITAGFVVSNNASAYRHPDNDAIIMDAHKGRFKHVALESILKPEEAQ
jgi:hypothetical protein